MQSYEKVCNVQERVEGVEGVEGVEVFEIKKPPLGSGSFSSIRIILLYSFGWLVLENNGASEMVPGGTRSI